MAIRHWRPLVAAAMAAIGFALTLAVFYPGVMTYDARFLYGDMARHALGDWQSPVMGALWSLVDPIAPGSGSLFLVTVTLYWLGFGVLAVVSARQSLVRALALIVLALAPPAFTLVGVIWRDILFAAAWLLAAALCFAVAGQRGPWRIVVQIVALVLVAFGVLLRQNAVIAAPILAAYVLWPARFAWKRAAILYLPAAVAFYLLIPLTYYGALGAARQHPIQSIMVYDLGGISHFARENQFPLAWSPEETALVTSDCYEPTEWNIYWSRGPCRFVMERLEAGKIFGSGALTEAWMRAVVRHPAAYLEHRLAFYWNFLARENITLWAHDLDDSSKVMFEDRPAFQALLAVYDRLKSTPLFRAGFWLLTTLLLCLVGWRRRETPAGAFILGVCGSAAIYVMTFLPVGVASDFRYAYWAVLASFAGVILARR